MFSNTSAEISLNTPSRCITAVRNDTRHHRFIVGTCAVPITPSSGGGHSHGYGHGNANANSAPHSPNYPGNVDIHSRGHGHGHDGGASSNTNPLYLLRYHEEMNELAVDAQLVFEDDHHNRGSGSGEVWSCSSCPLDKRLLVTCRSRGIGVGASSTETETALWRIPEDALREDDIDFYPDEGMGVGVGVGVSGDDDDHDHNFGIGGHDHRGDDRNMHMPLEKVMVLNLDSSERVTDMQWNPACFPDADGLDVYADMDDAGAYGDTDMDEEGDANSMRVGGVGGGAMNRMGGNGNTNANFLTVQGGRREVCVTTWDMQIDDASSSSNAVQLDRIVLPISERGRTMSIPAPPKASWDPHHPNLCAVTVGTGIAILDLRCSGSSSTQVVHGMKSCHRLGVTGVDYNPNKLHVLTSSGQDGLVKFWDLRFTSTGSSFDDLDQDALGSTKLWQRHTPLKILRGGHTHWATDVQYNSFHDQLLLSGGTDGIMNLWRISSISSAPLLDLGGNEHNVSVMDDFASAISPSPSGALDDDDDMPHPAISMSYDDDVMVDNDDGAVISDDGSEGTDGGNAPDVRVTKMEMREAIYDLAWSAADPWVYVTLGFDGNVVLNHVSSKEKYKILL